MAKPANWILMLLIAFGACEASKPHRAATTVDGLPRLKVWSESKVLQGAQPEGDQAFKNLADLGVTTVVSVDGAVPDVATAKKYGLSYVHVPIGYDGVPREAALQIIKSARDSKGKVYMHCHHGRHRGPTAVMLYRLAFDGISHDDAVHCMEESGTSPKYAGLYRDVRTFKLPTQQELDAAPAAPSVVRPAGLRAAMVGFSDRFEYLKASRANGWKLVDDNPDVSPPHEARMLREHYRESARLDDVKQHGDAFATYLKEGEAATVSLENALRAKDHTAASKAYKTVKANCAACHADFRN